jgi:hypothetical protein
MTFLLGFQNYKGNNCDLKSQLLIFENILYQALKYLYIPRKSDKVSERIRRRIQLFFLLVLFNSQKL